MARVPTRPIGQAGEDAAADFLRRRGMTIVERNVRSRLGEIDLIGREGATLVFVEVKARRGWAGDPPQAAVDGRKRARLGRLALAYLARHPDLREARCRFDVVAVTLDPSGSPPRLDHLPDAFGLDGWAG